MTAVGHRSRMGVDRKGVWVQTGEGPRQGVSWQDANRESGPGVFGTDLMFVDIGPTGPGATTLNENIDLVLADKVIAQVKSPLLLVPSMPAQVVRTGDEWAATRMVLAFGGADTSGVEMDVHYRAVGRVDCRSDTCVVIEFDGERDWTERPMRTGDNGMVRYAMRGVARMATGVGRLESSDFAIDIGIRFKGVELEMTADYRLRRVE